MSDNKKLTNPWEDANGATNVDGFLKALAEDDNTFWRMESGHALNIIEELIERLASKDSRIAELEKEVERLEGISAESLLMQFSQTITYFHSTLEVCEKALKSAIFVEPGFVVKCDEALTLLQQSRGGR